MNAFKKLIIEYDGILGTIREYTSKSNIVNYLSQLKVALDSGDYDAISYNLQNIIEWYDENLAEINENPYVFNFDSHVKNREILTQIYSELTPDDCQPAQRTPTSDQQTSKKLIFLSHKSNDKKYADALRDFIVGLGIQNNQLIYTSHPLHKIPMDENIYDYLRKNISSEIFMIILWSNDYLESPACLNEMGAAWVTQSDYTNIYVPTFSFGNPKYHECAVDTRKMGAVLNGDAHCKANLIELKNKILSMFDLKDDEQNSSYLIDQFIKNLTEVQNG